jgi:hypothetical protein
VQPSANKLERDPAFHFISIGKLGIPVGEVIQFWFKPLKGYLDFTAQAHQGLSLYAYLQIQDADKGFVIQILVIGQFLHHHAASTVGTEEAWHLADEKKITAQVAHVLIWYFQAFSSSFLCSRRSPCTACV